MKRWLLLLLVLVFLVAYSKDEAGTEQLINEHSAYYAGTDKNTSDTSVRIRRESVAIFYGFRMMVIPAGMSDGLSLKQTTLRLSLDSYTSVTITNT